MNKELLISAVFLVSCASSKQKVETALKVVNECAYLENYAEEITNALNDKNWNLALNVAGAAYLKSLETEGAPCLEGAKNLANQATQFIVESAKKNGVSQ